MNYFREDSFLLSLLSILVLCGIILVALAVQTAIDYTLRFSLGYEGDGDLLAARWIYSIIVFILTFLVFWFSWSNYHTPRSSLKKVTFAS